MNSDGQDIDRLNHTTNSLYSTSAHKEDTPKEEGPPKEIHKKDYKLVPNGIVVKNCVTEPKAHAPITSYIRPKAKR